MFLLLFLLLLLLLLLVVLVVVLSLLLFLCYRVVCWFSVGVLCCVCVPCCCVFVCFGSAGRDWACNSSKISD